MHQRRISTLDAIVLSMYLHSSIRRYMFLEDAVLPHLCLLVFFIHFLELVLSRAVVSSFNQFFKHRNTTAARKSQQDSGEWT